MKTFKIKDFLYMILGSILTLAIVFTIPKVSALTVTKDAKVTYKDIKIFIDGEAVTLKGQDGSTVEPIFVFDRLYAPVTSLARAFGKTVNYDSDTATVYIDTPTSKPKIPSKPKAYMFDVIKAYENTYNYYYSRLTYD